MENQRRIDCHTHIVNQKIKDAYYQNPGGYAIIMEFLPQFANAQMPDESWQIAAADERLFLSPSIDIHKEILPQLSAIEEKMLARPECKVVGLKIFLTYQKGRADDEKMMCIYDFARRYGLSVTYHTGLPSLHLPTDDDMEGSNAKYVRNVALAYPDVNFIVAHLDDPRFDECVQAMHGVPNLYSDFSGTFEPGASAMEDVEATISAYDHAIHQYPDAYRQILYGTDFCPPIALSAFGEYDETIRQIFTPDQFEDIYWNNPLRAFPKLAGILREKGIIK
ncbi:MAG: amidohydrolase family protein [Oscillospiraceae bacterium]|jgi:predicted TIM-barrel fold metal-dependent hydrolase|nr:amidohydrolase [Oscillospiraceae bacterium]MDD7041124.1 amidohydrolase family protein [Oscillospiraceae bacterium]MDY2611178.1 amidohydrolase family protein [Oscillospiraceae bacterium]